MKKLTVFETSILGFFVGVVVSTYITFVTSTDSFLGYILNWTSLRPLLEQFHIPENQLMLTSFLFFIAVFTLYGAIVGLIIKKLTKPIFIIVPVVFIFTCLVFVEQYAGSKNLVVANDAFLQNQTASVIKTVDKTPKQYFGTEATGDLNGDGKDDVAFLIDRNDDSRGMLYYLTTAITTDNGKKGTNLIFLGDGVVPTNISIKDGIVSIEHKTVGSEDLQNIQAHLVNGILEKISM